MLDYITGGIINTFSSYITDSNMNIVDFMDKKNKIRNRKLKEQEQRVSDILKASRKVFFDKGYLKTTMDEIAYEAAISKPTIYRFFSTKEDLYFSLIIPVLNECLQEMGELNIQLQLNMFNSGDKLLRDLIGVFFKKYIDSPDLFRIGQLFQQAGKLWTLDKKTESSVKNLSRAVMEEMRSILDSAINQGLIINMDRYIISEVIAGSLFGIIQLHDARVRGGSNDNRLEPVIEAIMGLFAKSIILK